MYIYIYLYRTSTQDGTLPLGSFSELFPPPPHRRGGGKRSKHGALVWVEDSRRTLGVFSITPLFVAVKEIGASLYKKKVPVGGDKATV